jgi:hypothetical protein
LPVFQNSVKSKCPPGLSVQQVSPPAEAALEQERGKESSDWAEQTVRPVAAGLGVEEVEVEVAMVDEAEVTAVEIAVVGTAVEEVMAVVLT